MVPIIALTGTATDRVQSKIISTLNMDTPNIIRVKCSRTNLFLQLLPKKDKTKKQISSKIIVRDSEVLCTVLVEKILLT